MQVRLPREFAIVESEINRALSELSARVSQSERVAHIASIRKPAPHDVPDGMLSVQRLTDNRKRLVLADQGQLYYIDLIPVGLQNDPNISSDTVSTAAYVTMLYNSALTNHRVLNGTSNRVIVTDNGPGSTVILSLPQDYHTAATPQLGRLGLGTSPDLTESLKTSGGVIIGGKLDHDGSLAGFYGVTPVTRPSTITQNYSTSDRTLSSYTPDVENTAYTGIDNAQTGAVYAKIDDLNALRIAYENLRTFVEDAIQLLNAVVDDLQNLGLES